MLAFERDAHDCLKTLLVENRCEASVLYKTSFAGIDQFILLKRENSRLIGHPLIEVISPLAISIKHPLSGLYFTSPDQDALMIDLPANRVRVGEWETFALEGVEPSHQVQGTLRRLDQLLLSKDKAAIFLRSLEVNDYGTIALYESIYQIIDDSVYDAIFAALSMRPYFMEICLKLDIDDPYLRWAFQPLLRALKTHSWKHLPQQIEIGSEYNYLNPSSWGTQTASFWHSLNAAARRALIPAADLCLVATARNEGVYLLEWIAFHRRLGVDHFFIYTNDNEDCSDALLSAISSLGYATVIFSSAVPTGASAQNKAYAHALTVLLPVLNFRWCGIIDIDEFVISPPGVSVNFLKMMLSPLSQYIDAIVLNWATVGSEKGRLCIDRPLIQRCIRVFQDDERVVKSFVRPQRFIHASPHVASNGGKGKRHLVDADYACFRTVPQDEMSDSRIYRAISAKRPNSGSVVLYHYFFKSATEYLWKFSRNRGDFPKSNQIQMISEEHVNEYFLQESKDSVQSAALAHLPDLAFAKAQLLSVKEISDAYYLVLAKFHDRLTHILYIYQKGEEEPSAALKNLVKSASEEFPIDLSEGPHLSS